MGVLDLPQDFLPFTLRSHWVSMFLKQWVSWISFRPLSTVIGCPCSVTQFHQKFNGCPQSFRGLFDWDAQKHKGVRLELYIKASTGDFGYYFSRNDLVRFLQRIFVR
jgi:hypothetical protein